MSRNSVSATTHSAGPRIGRSSSRFFSMRPSHLVIEGGQPALLKITVWLGNKAADKYRLAPLFGRADVGKIPHGHRWDLPRSEFAPDSPLEGGVTSELVSGIWGSGPYFGILFPPLTRPRAHARARAATKIPPLWADLPP